MENNKILSFPVPTCSTIAVSPTDAFKVNLIEQTEKHKGRFTIVGGRQELPLQSAEQCARDEYDQEAGGKGSTLRNLRLWTVKTDPNSDVRQSTLGKLCNYTCAPEHNDIPVIGHYGTPDYLWLATVEGTPHPKDGEAKRCFYFDVRDIVITENEKDSKFGAQQDLILAVYRYALERGRQVETSDFANFVNLRERLLRVQCGDLEIHQL